MSEFLKFAWEIISQIVYNVVEVGAALVKLFITGWVDYFLIFFTYFGHFPILPKILSILLMLILVAIPVLILILVWRRIRLNRRLRNDKPNNEVLYKEIGRLNKQVLDLMDEKNSILALKVNAMGGTERIPYMGASALTDDVLPTVGNVADGGNERMASLAASAAAAAGAAAAAANQGGEQKPGEEVSRFPKLALVDAKFRNFEYPQMDTGFTLADFADQFRNFACSQMHLYYTPEIIRRYIAGMASSKLLILEGISGTGKTSLPYAFGHFVDNPATIISVQPSYRDKTELFGYFNEFSKRFNETEFLRAVYEGDWRKEPSTIVLDEMNLARIEYYFAEVLSVMEMPSKDEWLIDLVPTAWPGDPDKLVDGKLKISDAIWFVGTANNDDSTFTITDKVYDRAMPIELNERADAFECEPTSACHVPAAYLEQLFEQAQTEYPISDSLLEKMNKLDEYLQTRFKLAFGNRIMKQMHAFIPAYVACGGSELDAMDYILARKVLKKFESMNVSFVRDEITGLINYVEKIFGKTSMRDSKAYLQRIQNLY